VDKTPASHSGGKVSKVVPVLNYHAMKAYGVVEVESTHS